MGSTQGVTVPAIPTVPAGWYPDLATPGYARYYNGESWEDRWWAPTPLPIGAMA